MRHVYVFRLQSSKTLVVEAGSIEDLLTSHEQQLSQLMHLSADSAACRQTREQLQVCLLLCHNNDSISCAV